jgi:hypothetical protein
MRKILGIIGSALAVIAVIIGVVIFVLPNLRFGAGTGDGSGVVSGSSISTNKPSKSDLSKENKNSEIRIEEKDIYFDGELVDNVDNLKQKIIDIGTEREYTFVYDNAIKSTYDKVNEVLSELENTLGITINRE